MLTLKNIEKEPIHVIGIGSSAGGLESFKRFFSNMPEASGMAFVLVPHLDPTHKSILSNLIMQYTRMKVIDVSDGIKLEPNSTYIIPPNYNMTISEGALFLSEYFAPRGLRLPIDHFFRSLARDQKNNAIGIIFSGTGTDGTLGLREIKGVGGMTMVQDPASAKFDGMPRSAIKNALVDYILPPDKMPEQLIKYVKKQAIALKKGDQIPSRKFSDSISEIFTIIKNKTNRDFSGYKDNTMIRRIERRILINHFNTVSDYLDYLKDHPNEVELLFKELLIGVTNFFRDKKAFTILKEKVIPLLLKDSPPPNQFIKIWVPGCSTGEEAYSIAILFQEYLEKTNQEIKIQIFATDIDPEAIEKARLGIFPDNIAADISPVRLKKYFILEGNLYQIKKKIREKIVFAVQDVINDPPFSKVDLISCRNLLIYLNPDIQKRLVLLFHYSLNPEGFLFLGNSETNNSIPKFFTEINRKWKIFQRKPVSPFLMDIPKPFPPLIDHHLNRKKKDDIKEIRNMDYRQILHKVLLENYSPPSLIISGKGDIHYIHGQVSKFLEIQSGEAKMNIYRMAKDKLKLQITSALRRVQAKGEEVKYKDVMLKSGDDTIQFNLRVIPILTPIALKGLFIISFEEVRLEDVIPKERLKTEPTEPGDILKVKRLEEELISTKQYLQTTIEELEATNEELQSTNEELQSSNEELQTSQEELQSVNEELITMNNELESKITELKKTNDDMRNLMVSSQIGTIFLDESLTIQRFTPASKEILNLIETDIGRPLQHITTNLLYDNLLRDAQEVLETLIPKERDVQIKEDGWFNMRIHPYRTEENIIKGVVLTFLDITHRYLLEKEKSEALQFVDDIVETIRNPIIVLSQNLTIIRVNKAFFELFKTTSREVNNKYLYDIGNGQWDIPKLRSLLENIIENHNTIENYEVEHEFENIGPKIILLNAKEIIREDKNSLILLAMEDITERKYFERKLRNSKEQFKQAYNRAELLKDLFTHDINNIIQVILTSNELLPMVSDHPEKREQAQKLTSIITAQLIQAKTLVRNIQLISTFEKADVSKHPINIEHILKEAINYTKKSYRNKNLNINLQKHDNNLKVLANELISGVIENILNNAIKHNDQSEIIIDIKISTQMVDNIKYVKIEFKDNGPEINDEMKPKIFRRGFQRTSEGLGIGLTIIEKIIESYNGKVWVENRIADDYSKGSNFVLLIPEAN